MTSRDMSSERDTGSCCHKTVVLNIGGKKSSRLGTRGLRRIWWNTATNVNKSKVKLTSQTLCFVWWLRRSQSSSDPCTGDTTCRGLSRTPTRWLWRSPWTWRCLWSYSREITAWRGKVIIITTMNDLVIVVYTIDIITNYYCYNIC